ncbi:MAG: lysylphosphatidylglycerol synthase transmembrane domain-containing protein [Candidatus Margulisiibacteriota bacterium]
MRRFSFFLGILVSLALLFLLFFNIDFSQFIAAFRKANYYYAFLIIILVFAGCYVRALRWRWLMMPIKKISPQNLFMATILGYMGNALLPARMGEFVRAHVIGRREGISRASSFATIIIERLLDGLSILILLVLVLFWIKVPVQGALIVAGWSALLLYSLIILIILMFNFKKKMVLNFFGFIFHFLPLSTKQKIIRVIESLADGFKIVEKGHHFLIIVFYSFLIWAITALGIYVAVLSFGYSISYEASVFILVLLAFVVMIPSAPGFIGTLDAGMAYGLMLFAVPREAALSIAVFYHGLSFLPIVVLGFYYLWRYNLSLSAE